jgi:hypothetical protein
VATLQGHSVEQLPIEDRGMPSSAVRTFTDPDDYAATVRGGTVDLTITVRGNFTAKLTRIDLHCLRMQRLHDNLPRIAEARNIISGRAYISFRTRPGPSLVQAATELQAAGVLQLGPANEYYQRSSGSADLGTMSLGVLQILQARHVLAQRLLAGGAQLIAALREQHVASDDPLVFCLHLGDLLLLRAVWARACCNCCVCCS